MDTSYRYLNIVTCYNTQKQYYHIHCFDSYGNKIVNFPQLLCLAGAFRLNFVKYNKILLMTILSNINVKNKRVGMMCFFTTSTEILCVFKLLSELIL